MSEERLAVTMVAIVAIECRPVPDDQGHIPDSGDPHGSDPERRDRARTEPGGFAPGDPNSPADSASTESALGRERRPAQPPATPLPRLSDHVGMPPTPLRQPPIGTGVKTRADTTIDGPAVGTPVASTSSSTRMRTSDPFAVHGVRGPLVGRGPELRRLLEVVDAALDFSAPQLVSVLGNQGTGKSRLIDELMQRAAHKGCRVYAARAAQGDKSYGAIVRFLRERFSLSDAMSESERMTSFRQQVEQLFGGEPVPEVVHFLGHFLELHFPDSPFLRVLGESPAQHDEIARTVLRRLIEVDAALGPLLLVFDDLQWADDDTLELLSEIGANLGGSAVVMVAGARPELMVRFSGWGGGVTDHVRVDLRNLTLEDAEVMLRNLLEKCEGLTDDIVDDSVEMTGGNPQFLEQLVRLFHENGTIDKSATPWRIDAEEAAATELPISIEEAIEARIAALETPEREVLEKGAVFGNVFWIGAVVALARMEHLGDGVEEDSDAAPPIPDDPLDIEWGADPQRSRIEMIIEDLGERDYLLRLDDEDSTVAGDVEVVFKHNLERELIAHSTEGKKLVRYHRLAAQWLESKLLERSEEQLEFLAQLYARGGENRRAAYCFLAGGDKARARYANEQAVELYHRGLEMLEGDEPVARLDALHNLGTVLVTMGQTDEAKACFIEMLSWAWRVDHVAKGGAAHGRLGRLDRDRGDYDTAMAHLRRAHDLFGRADDKRGMASTLDDMGRVHWLRGAYGQALDYHRQALAIRRALGDRRSIALSLANIGRVHNDQGAFKAANRQFREALDLRRDIGDQTGVVESLCDLAGVHTADSAFEIALEMLGEAHRIAGDIGDKLAQCAVLVRMGRAKSAMGDGTAAVEHLMEGISLATQLGHRAQLAECRVALAEVYCLIGDGGQGYDQSSRALKIGEQIGSRALVGSAHRVIAESLAMSHAAEDRGRAEGHYRRALEIQLGMKNELQLALTFRSFGGYCETAGRTGEAQSLRSRADEIYTRLRGAASFD